MNIRREEKVYVRQYAVPSSILKCNWIKYQNINQSRSTISWVQYEKLNVTPILLANAALPIETEV